MPLAVVEVTAVTVGAVVSMAIDLVPPIEPAEPGRRQGQAGGVGVGDRVEDRAAVERQGAGAGVVELGAVLAGGDGVGEGQGAGAAAAGVAGGAAGVERQLGRAGDDDGLTPADGDGDDRADAVGAVGGG